MMKLMPALLAFSLSVGTPPVRTPTAPAPLATHDVHTIFVDGAWLVAWQEGAYVVGRNLLPDGSVGEVQRLARGRLIGAVAVERSGHVVTLDGVRVRNTTLLASLPFPNPIITERTTLGAAIDSSHVGIHSGNRTDGSPYALVTWWPTPTTLEFAELAEDGAVLPALSAEVETPYDPQAVERAIRLIRGR